MKKANGERSFLLSCGLSFQAQQLNEQSNLLPGSRNDKNVHIRIKDGSGRNKLR